MYSFRGLMLKVMIVSLCPPTPTSEVESSRIIKMMQANYSDCIWLTQIEICAVPVLLLSFEWIPPTLESERILLAYPSPWKSQKVPGASFWDIIWSHLTFTPLLYLRTKKNLIPPGKLMQFWLWPEDSPTHHIS